MKEITGPHFERGSFVHKPGYCDLTGRTYPIMHAHRPRRTWVKPLRAILLALVIASLVTHFFTLSIVLALAWAITRDLEGG